VSQIESLSQIEEKLNNLSLTAKNNIDNSNIHEELDQLRVSLLGKKGDLSIILKTKILLSNYWYFYNTSLVSFFHRSKNNDKIYFS